MPVDPAAFVEGCSSRCCFHGHPASNANCLVAALTPASLTALAQSSGEPPLSLLSLPFSLFLFHPPSQFLSPYFSRAFFVLFCFNNVQPVTTAHTQKRVRMRERGELMRVVKAAVGSMGTTPCYPLQLPSTSPHPTPPFKYSLPEAPCYHPTPAISH